MAPGGFTRGANKDSQYLSLVFQAFRQYEIIFLSFPIAGPRHHQRIYRRRVWYRDEQEPKLLKLIFRYMKTRRLHAARVSFNKNGLAFNQ
jgi:hypothetical protein